MPAESVFSNLRLRGTLAVVGVATLASAVITTLTVTTGNFTTMNAQTASGTLVRGTTLSGYTMRVNKLSAGSGKLVVHGGDGGYICLRDKDDVGWTMVSGNNGVLISNGADSTQCP